MTRYLRISKQQDESYKSIYLIDVANFEIVSVDTPKKEVIYKSYDNGEVVVVYMEVKMHLYSTKLEWLWKDVVILHFNCFR